jgi:very-short-patch-repair endonuclease
MGQLATFDRDGLAELLRRQQGVISRRQAANYGMSLAALRHRIREGGRWQALLPGVYLASTGRPDDAQRQMAALLYAGPGAIITGHAALAFHRLRAEKTGLVDVLVPLTRRRQDVGFVRLHRTSRVHAVAFRAGEICYAPPARAVVDAIRGMPAIESARAVAADAVQRQKVFVWQLAEEISAGPARGSARARLILTELGDGVRSTAEADLRALIKRERLPVPMFNPQLFVAGVFIAQPDTWWPEAGLAGEVDSREYHLLPSDWERTLERDARMAAHGIVVLHFTPRQLRTKPQLVAAQIRSALEARQGVQLPKITAQAA